MNYREAKTKAQMQANIWDANYVIGKNEKGHFVYSEKQYPAGYLELVEPNKSELKKVAKKKVDAD